MSINDIPILDSILKESRQTLAPDMNESEFFELFCCQQILRDEQLGKEDIEAGLTGNDKETGSDGGIDGIYVMVHQRVVNGAYNLTGYIKKLKGKIPVNVVIVQATRENGFNLKKVLRLKDTAQNIFSLAVNPKDFDEAYNDSLRSAIHTFRKLHTALQLRNRTINVSFFMATKGDTATVSNTVKNKAKSIKPFLKKLLGTIDEVEFTFVGARELIDLATKPPKEQFSLKCSDSLSSGKKNKGHVALVKLGDYFKFITSEDTGELRSYLFDSNVRDHQGDVTVNEAIQKSLTEPGKADFWWLNNGITVVADHVGGTTKELEIQEPQIVNGLQTSQEIFDYFKRTGKKPSQEKREILVRIIETPAPEIQDNVIRATNSQTGISAASLYATQTIHRDIEMHLAKKTDF